MTSALREKLVPEGPAEYIICTGGSSHLFFECQFAREIWAAKQYHEQMSCQLRPFGVLYVKAFSSTMGNLAEQQQGYLWG